MELKINQTGDHNDYFTLTDDAGNKYPWHCREGVKQDPEKVLLLIRRREYPTAIAGRDYIVDEGQSELEAFEEWIADGAMLRNDDGEYSEKAERVYWVSTHPTPERIIDGEKITGDTLAALTNAKTIAELKQALITIFKGG